MSRSIRRLRTTATAVALPGTALAFALALCVAPTGAEEPTAADDDEWISLTGTVAATDPERFTLDYGEGLVTVEMADWDADRDGYDETSRLIPGDRVTVYGRMDDSLYERRTVEADSLYVHDRSSYYATDDADDVRRLGPPNVVVPDGSWISLSGTVEEVSGRELRLDVGDGDIVQVDTILMEYDPLDEAGFQKIDKGDRVSVTGRLDLDFFERREIQAETIVRLERDAPRRSSGPRG